MAEKLKRWEKGAPIPESYGRCADLYKEVEEIYKQMQRETDEVKARLTELREHMIQGLSKSDDTGAAGLKYRVQVKTQDKAKPADWEAIWAFIQDTGRFDLLQKRLSDKAVLDMLEQGDPVPGTERIRIPTLSITKI